MRLALSFFTVLPVRADRFDRATARVAMVVAPLVGALLGLVLGLVGLGLVRAGATALLAAALVVALSLVLTRGLHIDGLADTADGLGSFADADKALEIMKKSDIGPFGVAAIGCVLLVDAAAGASVLASGRWWYLIVAFAAGRLSATIACRPGLPAARPSGLGSLVAETVGWPLLGAVVVAIGGLAALADPLLGPLAVLTATALTWGLTAHARRRLGGVTGDVIGAAVELSTAAALTVLAIGG